MINNLSPEEFKRINLGTSLRVNNFNLRFCDQNECVIMRWSDVINNSHPLSFKTKVILPSGEKKQTVYNEARVKLLMNKKKQNRTRDKDRRSGFSRAHAHVIKDVGDMTTYAQ